MSAAKMVEIAGSSDVVIGLKLTRVEMTEGSGGIAAIVARMGAAEGISERDAFDLGEKMPRSLRNLADKLEAMHRAQVDG